MPTETESLNVRIMAMVEQHYVLVDRVPGILDSLSKLPPSLGSESGDDQAEMLTEALWLASGDRHLRVRARPPTETSDLDWTTRMTREAKDNSGGIALVRRVDRQTGLVGIAPYLSAVHLAEPFIDSAFRLLADVESLVIDVRAGAGGTPETVALVCSYLLGDEPVHLQDVQERGGVGRQFWTTPARARLSRNVRVTVLTSARTFSGCEELAYDLQVLGRAVVVGERTLGGAHPVRMFRLSKSLDLSVPVARSVNATTGTNWEGTGVEPDINVSASDALKVALA